MANSSGQRFTPRADVPRYSRMLYETVRSPVVVYMILAGNLVFIAASTGFYAAEAGVNPAVDTWMDAFWWGLSTVTTVGFGDIVPITSAGRLIGFGLMVTGVLLFVGSTALISSAFFARTQGEIIELEGQTHSDWQKVLDELSALRTEVAALRSEKGTGT